SRRNPGEPKQQEQIMNDSNIEIGNSIRFSDVLRQFLLIAVALACSTLPKNAVAVTPAPDGGYPGDNTADGDFALLSLTTGRFNNAIGFDALLSNTTATGNTAIGAFTLEFNTTGSANTAIGFNALSSTTAGVGNTATGLQALEFNTTGSFNTAYG